MGAFPSRSAVLAMGQAGVAGDGICCGGFVGVSHVSGAVGAVDANASRNIITVGPETRTKGRWWCIRDSGEDEWRLLHQTDKKGFYITTAIIYVPN
jgi:hypothetical protein